MHKIFLGGTCADSTWRDELMPCLQVPYFNPVVEDWTPECVANENYEKEFKCDVHLYVITSAMKGFYSISEVVQSSNDKNKVTILQIIPDGFSNSELKSLYAVREMVKNNSGIAYVDSDLMRAARILNECFGLSVKEISEKVKKEK